MSFPVPDVDARSALTPTGRLRAAINLSNDLLVTGRDDDGLPEGVSPDLAKVLAEQLDVEAELIGYANPGSLTDAATRDEWDIGNVGAAPGRTEVIAFSPPYCQIECTYLVPPGSSIQSVDEVDRPGVRVAATNRTAYGLWLEHNLRHAELVLFETHPEAWEGFVEGLDALAGLRPRHLRDRDRLPGSSVLPGRFAAVQQAIGTPATRDTAGLRYLTEFVRAAVASGLVADLIATHGVDGRLAVADLESE